MVDLPNAEEMKRRAGKGITVEFFNETEAEKQGFSCNFCRVRRAPCFRLGSTDGMRPQRVIVCSACTAELESAIR